MLHARTAWIAENAGRATGGKDLKIPLVLSGDSHHYARYAGPGTQYVTSGGGGAFLHGTLELQEVIKAHWLKERDAQLELKHCYPSKRESSELLDGNRRFSKHNPELATALSFLYLACAFCLALAWRWDIGIGLLGALVAVLYGYARYQEGPSPKVLWLSLAHAAVHMAGVVLLAAAVRWLSSAFGALFEWHWAVWLAACAALSLTAGRWFAGQVFGWNLLITCRYFGINHNDAFSAMKLDCHRHFLRIRILGDTATVYPVKLDKVPTRDEWRENPSRLADPSASVFIPLEDMMPGLIEPGIVIQARHAPTTDNVKTPSELSSGDSR